MSSITRGHLAGLELALSELDIDGAAAGKLNHLIAQASAAPEQEAVTGKQLYDLHGRACGANQDPYEVVTHEHAGWEALAKLYTHADPSEVERLRAELADSDACVVRALNERDAGIEEWSGIAVQSGMECDRLREQLAEAQALLRDADGWVRVLRTQFGYDQTAELAAQIDAFLSTTAQPAEPAARILMPEYKESDLRSPVYGYARGFNAALDEVASLNGVKTNE